MRQSKCPHCQWESVIEDDVTEYDCKACDGKVFSTPPPPPPGQKIFKSPPNTASAILEAGAGHLSTRAKTYDRAGGERSMERTVVLFNELVGGPEMTPEQGWLFMALLKMVRSQAGEVKLDSYEDMAAYCALAGEQAIKDRAKQ